MVRQVRILGDVVINELEDVALMCDHDIIRVRETDHRVVAEHRGGDVDAVMILVGPRVRRFQGPMDDGRRRVSSTNKFETADEHVVRDDVGTGTRSEGPSSRPFIDANTKLVARAAPVDVGIMLIAAPRARRRSLCGPSTSDWSPVYACTVVMRPCFTPNASSSTLMRGTKQFVVQLAFEMTWCFFLSKSVWLTP